MDKVRRWNAAVPIGTYVRVLDPEAVPWSGPMQSLAFIDDQNRVVAKVLSGSPTETITVQISHLRPIHRA
jgi:hypothetical protein